MVIELYQVKHQNRKILYRKIKYVCTLVRTYYWDIYQLYRDKFDMIVTILIFFVSGVHTFLFIFLNQNYILRHFYRNEYVLPLGDEREQKEGPLLPKKK